MMGWVRGVILLLLAVAISACSSPGGLKTSVVEQAIALTITQVQQELNQQLYRTTQPPPQINLSHISVTQRDSLKIQGVEGFRIQGTYDVTLTYRDHTIRERQNPFELYLQHPSKDTWALARPLTSSRTPDEPTQRQWDIRWLQAPPTANPDPAGPSEVERSS